MRVAVDGMRVFIFALLGFDIKPEEVKVMLQDNPAKLIWLDWKEARQQAVASSQIRSAILHAISRDASSLC